MKCIASLGKWKRPPQRKFVLWVREFAGKFVYHNDVTHGCGYTHNWSNAQTNYLKFWSKILNSFGNMTRNTTLKIWLKFYGISEWVPGWMEYRKNMWRQHSRALLLGYKCCWTWIPRPVLEELPNQCRSKKTGVGTERDRAWRAAEEQNKGAKVGETWGRVTLPNMLLKLLVKDKPLHSRNVLISARRWQTRPPRRGKWG